MAISIPLTYSFRVTMGEAISVSEVTVDVSYREKTTTPSWSILGSTILLDDTSAATLVSAPTGTNERSVEAVHVYNSDTTAHTLTFDKFASATAYPIHKLELGPGETATYEDGVGWTSSPAPTSAVDAVTLNAVADPSATSAGTGKIYAKSIAGRVLPKWIGPAGVDTIMQVGLSGNSVFLVAPASTTTAPTAIGGTLTTAATMSAVQTIASANPWAATWKKQFATAATAASVTGMRTAYVQWFRGDAPGFGGFFFRAQLGQGVNLNGAQTFVGLCASTAAIATTANAVSALLNMCGMGYDSSDASTGNWFFLRNDGTGTATKVDLGTDAARNTTHGYDLCMYMAPGGSTLFVRIANIHSGVTVLDTSYTTDLPAANTGMAFKAEITNAAVASATNLQVAKVYIESDY